MEVVGGSKYYLFNHLCPGVTPPCSHTPPALPGAPNPSDCLPKQYTRPHTHINKDGLDGQIHSYTHPLFLSISFFLSLSHAYTHSLVFYHICFSSCSMSSTSYAQRRALLWTLHGDSAAQNATKGEQPTVGVNACVCFPLPVVWLELSFSSTRSFELLFQKKKTIFSFFSSCSPFP